MSSRGKKTVSRPKASPKLAKLPKKKARPAPKRVKARARGKALTKAKVPATARAKATLPVKARAKASAPAKVFVKPASARVPPSSRSFPPMVATRRPLPPPLPVRPPAPKVVTFARSYYWSDLRVGDDLPPLSKAPIDRVQIARYSAAANDLNRLHVDEPYAQRLGFRGAFAPGSLVLSFMGQLLSLWLKKGHVRKLSGRFVKLVWPGDELTCRGRIATLRRDKGACAADLELWAENQKGELVLRGQATCDLVFAPPAGSGGFLASLEHRPGRSSLPRPPGTPFRRR